MIASYTCKHTGSIFIGAERMVGDGESWRCHSYVCPHCGLFQIVGQKNGEHFRVEFTLCLDEQVKAAGQHVKWLTREMSTDDDSDLPPGAVPSVAGAVEDGEIFE